MSNDDLSRRTNQYAVGFASAILCMALLAIVLHLGKSIASNPQPAALIDWATAPMFTPLDIVWIMSIQAVIYGVLTRGWQLPR